MQQINLKIGNVLDKLKEIPDNSVDCVCTSPPYYGLRKYKAPDVIFGGDQACEHEWSEYSEKLHNGRGDAQNFALFSKQSNIPDMEVKHNFCSKCGAWKGQLGLEPKALSKYDGIPLYPMKLREDISEEERNYVLKELKKRGINAKDV